MKQKPRMIHEWNEKAGVWTVPRQRFDEELDEWVLDDDLTPSERLMKTNKNLRKENVKLLHEREELQGALKREKQAKVLFMLTSLFITISAGVLIYG